MLLLDTNAVSELRKMRANRANRGVVDWASKTHPADMYISAISLMEIEQGVLLIERRDRPQGAIYRRWLNDYVFATFNGRTLPVDAAVALRAAALHVPDPQPERETASLPRPRSCTA